MAADDPLNPYAPPKAPTDGPADDGQESPPRAARDRPKARWTTVAVYGDTARALEALRLLEQAKIECRVLEDGTTQSSVALHWVRSMPLGGHAVQVHTRHLDHAAAVLGVTLERDEEDGKPV